AASARAASVVVSAERMVMVPRLGRGVDAPRLGGRADRPLTEDLRAGRPRRCCMVEGTLHGVGTGRGAWQRPYLRAEAGGRRPVGPVAQQLLHGGADLLRCG